MEETDGDPIEFLEILTEKLYVRFCQVRLFFCYKQMKLCTCQCKPRGGGGGGSAGKGWGFDKS